MAAASDTGDAGAAPTAADGLVDEATVAEAFFADVDWNLFPADDADPALPHAGLDGGALATLDTSDAAAVEAFFADVDWTMFPEEIAAGDVATLPTAASSSSNAATAAADGSGPSAAATGTTAHVPASTGQVGPLQPMATAASAAAVLGESVGAGDRQQGDDARPRSRSRSVRGASRRNPGP